MAEMRKTSESSSFPFESKMVCYFAKDKQGNIEWIDHTMSDRRGFCDKLSTGEYKLYAVWAGQYRCDLFEVDNIEEYLKMYSRN